jgi:hypothetical protein
MRRLVVFLKVLCSKGALFIILGASVTYKIMLRASKLQLTDPKHQSPEETFQTTAFGSAHPVFC